MRGAARRGEEEQGDTQDGGCNSRVVIEGDTWRGR